MAEETSQGEVELTPHEQEMVTLVDAKEAESKGLANPSEAPEYKEEPQEESKEPFDYKAAYEKLIAEKESPSEPQVNGLEVPDDDSEPPSEDSKQPELDGEALSKYTEEFTKEGKLSEESYKELEKLGFSKSIIDGYVEGQAALQEARTNKVYEAVGGVENYKEMVQWAKETWSAEQIDVFNRSVASNDEAQVMFSVNALEAQYKAAGGSNIPSRALRGDSKGTTSTSNSYETRDEMYKAMSNPLYGKDASYTNMVAQKIANSSF